MFCFKIIDQMSFLPIKYIYFDTEWLITYLITEDKSEPEIAISYIFNLSDVFPIIGEC